MEDKRMKVIVMRHWGEVFVLPSVSVGVKMREAELIVRWWIFRVSWRIEGELPERFMKYVWSSLNLDFSWAKNEDEKEIVDNEQVDK